jgi:hypothetical protein
MPPRSIRRQSKHDPGVLVPAGYCPMRTDPVSMHLERLCREPSGAKGRLAKVGLEILRSVQQALRSGGGPQGATTPAAGFANAGTARVGGPFLCGRRFIRHLSTSLADAFDLLVDLHVFCAHLRVAGSIRTAGGDRAVDLPAARSACSITGCSNGGRTARGVT